MSREHSRRKFMQQSAALGAGFYFVSGTPARSAPASPLSQLNVGVIGAGGKGSSDCDNAAHWGANIAALCDIDSQNLKKKAVRFPQARQFADWREMLDVMGDKIDAVTVSTPDHSHAVASIAAMKRGKHVYCQKPLTWSIAEARRMRELAAEKKVVTQMGNQGTSENNLREAVEVVKSGGIGEVTQVHVWTNRPVWDQGKRYTGFARPQAEAIPSNVNWYLFLGPAPDRPYSKVYHPFSWRGWLDFGTGALGDMACHTANMAVMALDLFEPKSFEAIENTGIVGGEQFPRRSTIKFEFGTRGSLPPCTLFWYDGGNLPGEDVLSNDEVPQSFREEVAKKGRKDAMSSGSLLVGSKGKLFSPNDYGAQYYLLPEKDFASFQKPSVMLPRVTAAGDVDQRHMSEFIAACKGEGKTMSNFEYAGRLTETILCGNLALRFKESIEWDAVNMKATNCNEANHYVHREYRDGYSI